MGFSTAVVSPQHQKNFVLVFVVDLDFSDHLPRLTIPGHSALSYGGAKVRKYSDAITPSVHFSTAIADVFGFWHPDIITFITSLALTVVEACPPPSHLSDIRVAPVTHSYAVQRRIALWMSRFSCSLMRSQAEMIQHLSRVVSVTDTTFPHRRQAFIYQ